jgi:hypothetical protein
MGIPRYPETRPITLEDKPHLDGIFTALQPRISELTFANLYLFRTVHNYRLAMVDDALVVRGRGYDGEEYFLPPLSGDVDGALAVLLADGLTLYGADDEFAARHLRSEKVTLAEDRANFDYLYLRSELAELPGNRFHKKKNRVNYFASRHDYSVEPFAGTHRQGCIRLLDRWRDVHDGIDSNSLAAETEADREALEGATLLGLEGLVVLAGGEVRAFVLGERLNSVTSVCHFEKADPFMDGLYQLIDREFNSRLFTDCTYVNREQDLGEANIRQSKLSYHPVELIKKYRARRR